MKAVILAGGLGTRISEETNIRPKPMVEIGGMPILWHIMKMYSSHGINDFIICCGYKGYIIKEYFANYFLYQSDVTFCMKENTMKVHKKRTEPWTVTLVDTGEDSMTGGRLARVEEYIKDEKAFCFTYGDGLSDRYKNLPGVDRSIDDDGNVIFMHLGRGIPKSDGTYWKNGKTTVLGWEYWFKKNIQQ